MCGSGDADFEATVRRAFARLTRDELPKAAEARGWPVRTRAEFERLLLEHLDDGSGDIPREPSLMDLVLAVELGERLLAGNCCCTRMSYRRGRVAAPTAFGRFELRAAAPHRAKPH